MGRFVWGDDGQPVVQKAGGKNGLAISCGLLDGWRGGLNEVVEFGLEGVENAQGVMEPFRLLPEPVGFFGIRMPHRLPIPRLDLAFDLDDQVFVDMRVDTWHGASLQAAPRNAPSFAVALNWGIGSRSLKAEVKAFERLHMVRGANSSNGGLK